MRSKGSYSTLRFRTRHILGAFIDVPRGRILGLLGKNGTGKTTTLNILMGFLRPQSGSCRIFGEEITPWLRPHADV